MKESPYIPTELEIEMSASRMFPDSPELQSSYIMGVHHTIYYNLKP
jgi:hypothetical protein